MKWLGIVRKSDEGHCKSIVQNVKSTYNDLQNKLHQLSCN